MSPIIPSNAFVEVDGVNVFYRYAGPTSPDAPTIVLLHGFPTSSFQFRNLIPLLAQKYRVIAPDHPGYGFTEVPAERNYQYTFASLTDTFEKFAEALKLKKFVIYTFDYGAPIGYRYGLKHPDRITAIIAQNGNMYEEGLGEAFWAPFRKVWADPNFTVTSDAARKIFGPFLTLQTTRWQYTNGVVAEKIPHLDPATWHLDTALMAREGQLDVQISLFHDYGTNLTLYPQFHQWLRTSGIPVFAIWGKHDEIFTAPGAEAYKKDAKVIEIQYIDSGHFAIELNEEVFAESIQKFLAKNGL